MPYYRDIRDKISLYYDEIKYLEDKLKGLIDLLLALNGDSMNKVMKTLTIVSAVFIPLGFIAGVYGMNFEKMPGLSNSNGFYILSGLMFGLALFMFLIFKKKKWF